MYFKKITINSDSRCFFIGDLHGCYDEFMNSLDSVNFDIKKDIVVSTGDLIDRGPKSLECLKLILEPWFYAVCGNHEDMAIDSVIHRDIHAQGVWNQNGGDWFSNLSDNEQCEVFELLGEATKLPLLIEVEVPSGERIGVAHADIHVNTWLSNKANIESSYQLQSHVLWSRQRIHSIERMLKGNQKGCQNSFIEGVNAMLFGHTVFKEVFCYKNCLWIDTGVVFGNKLTIMNSEDVLSRAYSLEEEAMPEWS